MTQKEKVLENKMEMALQSDLWNQTVENYNYELYHHEAKGDPSQARNPEYAIRQAHIFYFYTVLCKYIRDNFNKNFTTEYGIGNNYKTSDLPVIKPNTKTTFKFAFPYNDAFRTDILKNVKKYRLTRSKSSDRYNGEFCSTYLVGYYKKQILMFRELTITSLDENERPASSYSLSLLVNGKREGEMPLIRFDYQPERIHKNRLHNKNIVKKRPETKVPATSPSHIHFSSMAYNILFPGYVNACDVVEVKNNKTFPEMVDFLKNTYQIHDNAPILSQTRAFNIKQALDEFLQNEQAKDIQK